MSENKGTATEVAKDEELDTGEAMTSALEEGATLEEVKEIQKIITSVKPVQLSDGSVVMFYNAELVNPQTISFIMEVMEMDKKFSEGTSAMMFRNDGPPYEFDHDTNEKISSLGCYAQDALVAVINLEGIYEKASTSIIDGESCESLPSAIYHLINRTAIHEIIHGSEYIVAVDKYAWQQDPGETSVEELTMLHLLEMAKKSPLIELPADIFTSEAWIDKKITGSIEEMRSGAGKKDDWEINQMYMVDNGKVYRSADETFSNMREYYRSMADDQDDASWTIEEPAVVEPEVVVGGESPEAMLGKALLTGDMAKVMELMSTLNAPVTAEVVTPEQIAAGAAMPVEMETGAPFTPNVVVMGDGNGGEGAGAGLLAEMLANTKIEPIALSSEEQLVRNIVDLLFNNMLDKCTFKQGHWTTPMAILDPVAITIPGAETVLHSFDYTDSALQYHKGELFGGLIKGQLDTRAGKLSRPAYVIHLKIGGQMITRRIQPPYVLNESGLMITCPEGKDPAMWQQTSLTFQAQQGHQIGLLRDPVNQRNVFTLTRGADGVVDWKAWK